MPRTFGIDLGKFENRKKVKVKLLAHDAETSTPCVAVEFDGAPWTVSDVKQNPQWLTFDVTPVARGATPDKKDGYGTLGDLTITIIADGKTSKIDAEVELK